MLQPLDINGAVEESTMPGIKRVTFDYGMDKSVSIKHHRKLMPPI
jgi:hypothetical protein